MRGIPAVCAVMAELPSTAPDIAKKFGHRDAFNVRRILAGLRQMGIVHKSGFVEASWSQPATVIWSRGRGPEVCSSRATKPPKMLNSVITFGIVYRLLSSSPSTAEVAEEVGVTPTHALRILKAMREAGLCHINGWELRGANHSATWGLGPGKTARKPKPMSESEANARHWAARKAKQQQAAISRALCLS